MFTEVLFTITKTDVFIDKWMDKENVVARAHTHTYTHTHTHTHRYIYTVQP